MNVITETHREYSMRYLLSCICMANNNSL